MHIGDACQGRASVIGTLNTLQSRDPWHTMRRQGMTELDRTNAISDERGNGRQDPAEAWGLGTW